MFDNNFIVELEERPSKYYVQRRTPLFSQGDIFQNAQLEIESGSEDEDTLSWRGLAMLITPTEAMRELGLDIREYTRTLRTFIPIFDLESMNDDGYDLGEYIRYDNERSYMYLPASEDGQFGRSLAALSLPVTVGHSYVEAAGFDRLVQLTLEGAQQLRRKLAWFATDIAVTRHAFHPPLL